MRRASTEERQRGGKALAGGERSVRGRGGGKGPEGVGPPKSKAEPKQKRGAMRRPEPRAPTCPQSARACDNPKCRESLKHLYTPMVSTEAAKSNQPRCGVRKSEGEEETSRRRKPAKKERTGKKEQTVSPGD